MFELDDKIVEEIVFAMENQEAVSFINTETGAVLSQSDDTGDAEESDSGDSTFYEPIPEWTSQDGFRLMELFAQSVGHPVVRSDLLAALARGRGVFRAFKNALEAHPDSEKKWFEYKARAMKARIVRWYEDLRDVRGLERLGLEPEDTDDLLLSDFQILRYGEDRARDVAALIRASRRDALARFPEAYVEYEYARMEREQALARPGEFSVYAAECEPRFCSAAAMVRTLTSSDRTFSALVFLYVQPERRRIGLGRKLAEYAREQSAQAGIRHFIVDIPFLGQEFSNSLEGLGYRPFGTRWLAVSDA